MKKLPIEKETHACMCDFCKTEKAIYDSKSTFGPWGYMCQGCFDKYGVKIKGLYSKLKQSEATGFPVVHGKDGYLPSDDDKPKILNTEWMRS